MERLASVIDSKGEEKKPIIQLTPVVEVNHLGQRVSVYHVNKRDSYMLLCSK